MKIVSHRLKKEDNERVEPRFTARQNKKLFLLTGNVMKKTNEEQYEELKAVREDAQACLDGMKLVNATKGIEGTISDSLVAHFKNTNFENGKNNNALTDLINEQLESLTGEDLAILKETIRQVFQTNLASAKVQKALFEQEPQKRDTHRVAMKKVNSNLVSEFGEDMKDKYVVVFETKPSKKDKEDGDSEESDEDTLELEVGTETCFRAELINLLKKHERTIAETRVTLDNLAEEDLA